MTISAHDDAITRCLDLAADLFPGVGFPNVTEAGEWAKELRRYREADVCDAIRRHWKDPSRKQNRPHLGAVLALMAGRELVRKPEEPTAAEVWARMYGLGGDTGKFEATLMYHRSEWSREGALMDKAAAVSARDEKVSAALADRRERVGKNIASRCAYCLISAGAEVAAAGAWSQAIFLPREEFERSMARLRREGMELAKASRDVPVRGTPQVFRSPPPPPETAGEAIKRLKKSIGADEQRSGTTSANVV
jgi:hypothetical protein